MRQISAPTSRLVTHVLPFLVVAIACVVVHLGSENRGTLGGVLTSFAIFVGLTGLLFYQLRKMVWRLAAPVYDAGDHLLVTRSGVTESIPLSRIVEIEWTPMYGGIEVVLCLAAPSKPGEEIRFYAPGKRRDPEIEDVLDSLETRINQQGQRGVDLPNIFRDAKSSPPDKSL